MLIDPATDLKNIGRKNKPQNEYSTIERAKPRKSLTSKIFEASVYAGVLLGMLYGSVRYSVLKSEAENYKFLKKLDNSKKLEYFVEEDNISLDSLLINLADVEGTERLPEFADYVIKQNNINRQKPLKAGQKIVVPDLNDDGYVGTDYSKLYKKISIKNKDRTETIIKQ